MPWKNLSILIVDDEPELISLLSAIINELSSPPIITFALTGEEGKKIILNSKEFAIVISNFNMGKGMTGADFLRFVKSNNPRTSRILMTSGLGKDSLLEMMTKDFIDDYTIKPVMAEHFLGQVEKSLRAYKNKT